MIELIPDLPAGTVGFTFSGEISGKDYDRVLVPAIDSAIDQFDRIKALLVFPAAFQGYSLEAAWDDTSLGLRHWDGFERMAVVSDVAWIRHSFRALGLLLPYPVRLFNAGQVDLARRWLAESLGTIHVDRQGDVICLRLLGRLDAASYARIDDDLASVFSQGQRPRLLLDLRDFDGWMGLGGLSQHLALLRDYRHAPTQVAVVGAPRWQHLGQRLLSRFSHASSRYFDSDHWDEAQQWITNVPVPA
jgi:hypothetical protein